MNFLLQSIKQSCKLCLLTVLLIFLAFPAKGMAQTAFAGGTGEEGNPYLITTETQLKEIANGLDKHYKLMNDIPLTGDWSPINNFTGSLEGDGFKITNLTIETTSNAGLFDTNKGTITNLGVAVASIKGKLSVGGIAGINNGSITNCFVTGGNIAAGDGGSVGGIAGSNNNTISNCYVALDLVQITVPTPNGFSISLGGIAGKMEGDGSIKYCLVANKEMSVKNVTGIKYANYIVGGDRKAQEFSADNKLNFFSHKVLRTDIFFNMTNPLNQQGMTGLLWPGSFPADDACKWINGDKPGTFYLKGPADKPIGAIDLSAHIYLDGKGTIDAPYQIKNEADLIKLRDYVNEGGSREEGMCYTLAKDITMSDTPFFPIGKVRVGGYDGAFCGIFNGDGYSIKNLKLDNTETNEVSLFGRIGEGAVIKNLAITDCNIDITHKGSGELRLAPIASSTFKATIENCYTTGTIKVASNPSNPHAGSVHVGGIAGVCDCTITNCYSDVNITADVQVKSNISYIGGIAGNITSRGTITNSFAKGTIEAKTTAEEKLYCGGISGCYDGSPARKCLALNPSIKANTPTTCYVSQIALKGWASLLKPYSNGNYAFLKMALFKNNASYTPISDVEELGVDGKMKYVEEDAAGWRGELPSDAWEKTDDGYVNLKSIAATFGLKQQIKLIDYVPFAITLSETIANGTLTADPTEAYSGDEITITVTPDPGYQLKENSLKYNDTQIVAVDDVYSFIMPSEAVTLSATFELDTLKLSDITTGNSVLISQEANDKTWWYEVKATEAGTKALRQGDSKIPFNGIITGTLANGKALVMGATCQSEITFDGVIVSTFIIEQGAAVVLSKESKLTYTTAQNNGGSLVAKAGATITDGSGSTIKTSAITFTESANGTFTVQVGTTTLASGDMVTEGSRFTVTATPAPGYETASVKVMQGTAELTATDGVYTMPGEAITITATFNRIEVTPPTPPATVYHTVTLPALIGAVTNPAVGRHEVEAWSNFLFVLTLDADYNQSIPLVKANGTIVAPRPSDGKYVINSVREDQTITIDGIVKNSPPVGNAEIETDNRIYTANGVLYVRVAQPTEAQIITIGGNVLRSLHLSPGETTVHGLSQGIYIVRLSNGTTQIVKI